MKDTNTSPLQILPLLREKRFAQLHTLLEGLYPADIAEEIARLYEEEELTAEELPLLFRLLPKELAADTFVDMGADMQQELIKVFSDKELREVINDLYVDDTVDLIEEMPSNVVKRILRSVDENTRKTINQILNYPDDSAGSIMTIEYVSLHKDMTVQQAFARIRKTGVDKETIYTCYVTENNKLIGLASVKDLLLADAEETIEAVMVTNIISVQTLDKQEQVVQVFNKYDFSAIPVVDNENRLVGIVTVDDVLAIVQETATEDIEKMAAITPSDKPYLKTGVFELYVSRIPWLLILMISATFTGMIIGYFEETLAAQVVLTTFIPMLMNTGGNSGSQSSVTIIRGLSLGNVTFSDLFTIVWKEIRVAVLCGITLAAAIFAKLMFLDRVGLAISLVVCSTLVCTVFFAKIVGCILPLLAKKLNLDPAVMASPFITTIVDALSLLIYFQFATIILKI